MDFLKIDSPFMNVMRTVTDIIILNLICLICCIPIVTIGPALAAKYYIAMKMTRDEEPGVVVPFFKAFISNFKQSILVWVVQLAIIALVLIDWSWIIDSGWNNVDFSFKFSIGVITAIVAMVNMVAYPLIARFKLSVKELYKAIVVFVFTHFIQLLGILALIVAGIVACIWYFTWLPLIAVVDSIAVTFFLAMLCDKEFAKIEKGINGDEEEHEVVSEDGDIEINEEEEEACNNVTKPLIADDKADADKDNGLGLSASEASSYAATRKELKRIADQSDHELEEKLASSQKKTQEEIQAEYKESRKIKNRIAAYYANEREKVSKLGTKQKLIYFADYYLPGIVVFLLLIGGVAWYVRDVIESNKIAYSGGLINCVITEEGRKFATEDFIEWTGWKNKKASLVDSDLSFDSTEVYDNQSMEVAFVAQISAGYYDYLIVNESAIEHYSELDFFVNLDELLPNMNKFEGEQLYFFNNVPVGLKLTDELEQKFGLDTTGDYYLTFVYVGNESFKNVMFADYLFGLSD